jgi:hypothetical protein
MLSWLFRGARAILSSFRVPLEAEEMIHLHMIPHSASNRPTLVMSGTAPMHYPCILLLQVLRHALPLKYVLHWFLKHAPVLSLVRRLHDIMSPAAQPCG